MLRDCAPCIHTSFAYLLILSISTKICPGTWKQAVVVPIFKNRGSKKNPFNYRPVSLLPAVAKVRDAIVSDRLLSYLTRKKLISTQQFDFLPQKSTVVQVVYVINQWLKTRGKGRESCAVLIDFVKAFDRVWYPGLLFKLSSTGAFPDCTAWFRIVICPSALSLFVLPQLCPCREK